MALKSDAAAEKFKDQLSPNAWDWANFRLSQHYPPEATFSADLRLIQTGWRTSQPGARTAELQPLIDKVWRHCETTAARGQTATLKVKPSDLELITRSRFVARHRYCEQSLQPGFRIAEAPDAAKEGETPTRHLGFRFHRART